MFGVLGLRGRPNLQQETGEPESGTVQENELPMVVVSTQASSGCWNLSCLLLQEELSNATQLCKMLCLVVWKKELFWDFQQIMFCEGGKMHRRNSWLFFIRRNIPTSFRWRKFGLWKFYDCCDNLDLPNLFLNPLFSSIYILTLRLILWSSTSVLPNTLL